MTSSAILTYHSLDSSGSVISVAPDTFRRHMELLAEYRIPVVPLSRIRQTDRAVSITFDDGFANLEQHAIPLLAEYRFPATVFLVSGFCGHKNDWLGQSPAVPRLPLLSWPTVQSLSSPLLEWGAHTVTHPNLANVSPATVEKEIRESRQAIEDRTGASVRAFAYPYGSVTPAAHAVASAQFETACGTRLRYLEPQGDPFHLPRLDAYYFRDPERLKTVLGRTGPAYIGLRRSLREGRAWLSR